jgi:ribosomal protein S18 acetylase RimI-like enzyme
VNDVASLPLIRTLETLAANAWPPAEAEALDGWRLRFTDGVTRRANSVWPNGLLSGPAVDELLTEVEAFYAQRKQPARFQLSPVAEPADLDQRLAERGYRSVASTAVQVAELTSILRQTVPLRLHPEFEVEVSEEFDEEWFALYLAIEHGDDPQTVVRQSILRRIAAPTGYVTLRIDGQAASVGLGVVEREWLGIFCMATAPSYRRRGAASAIVRTLAIWAQLYEANHAYLQVMEENRAAQALYARAGFETVYRYHYREK